MRVGLLAVEGELDPGNDGGRTGPDVVELASEIPPVWSEFAGDRSRSDVLADRLLTGHRLDDSSHAGHGSDRPRPNVRGRPAQ